MATGADYPTLHQSEREERREERGMGTHMYTVHTYGNVWRHTSNCYTTSKMLLQGFQLFDILNNQFQCINWCLSAFKMFSALAILSPTIAVNTKNPYSTGEHKETAEVARKRERK